MWPKIALAFIGLSILAGAACRDAQAPAAGAPPAADLVLEGGRIYTVDPAQPWAEAVAIRDGRFVYVGDAAGVAGFVGPATERHDLAGRMAMPGIVDAHTHPGMMAVFGSEEAGEQLPKESHEAILAFVADYAARHPELDKIVLAEWPTALYGVRGPQRRELDRAVPDRPVLLFDDSGHSTWVNTRMLELIGVDRDTPDVAPGVSYFQRDADGELTGWIKEFGGTPYLRNVLVPPSGDLADVVVRFLEFLGRHGVTTLLDGGNMGMDDVVYSEIAALERAGKLPLRYEGVYMVTMPEQIPGAIAELERLRATYGGERLRFNTMKILLDGIHEIRTAAILEDYADEPGNRGNTILSASALRDFILELDRAGLDLHLHTVSDRAVRTALDAVEAARALAGRPLATRVTLCHLELIDDADVPRFRELGVVANFTPHWHGMGYLYGWQAPLGPERAARTMRAQPLLDAGVVVNFGSDETYITGMPRTDPFYGMQVAHNRQDPEGGPDAPVRPPLSERLRLEDLVKGYTLNGAYQLRLDDEIGSIAVGKAADLLVLDTNLFEVDRYAVHRVAPEAVVMQGRVLYGRLP